MAFGRNTPHSYTFERLILYVLLWIVSVIVLGLSAWRIHHTHTLFHTYERIVAELLVTSLLTILWVPVAMFLLISVRTISAVSGAERNAYRHPYWPHEQFGGWILWIMYLVGAAILTNDFPTSASRGIGTSARLIASLIAFSWIAFGLLTLIGVLAWMHHASTRGPHGGGLSGRGAPMTSSAAPAPVSGAGTV